MLDRSDGSLSLSPSQHAWRALGVADAEEARRHLAGRLVMVVEDEYVIARDLAETLEAAGARVAGPVATLHAAQAMLERCPDIAGAVLDVKLHDDMAYPLIPQLRRRSIPFVLATGYDRDALPATLRDAVLCEKPLEPARVVAALARCMGAH